MAISNFEERSSYPINLQGLSGTSMCSFGNIQMSLNYDFQGVVEGSTVHCLPVRLNSSEKNYEKGAFGHIHGLIID